MCYQLALPFNLQSTRMCCRCRLTSGTRSTRGADVAQCPVGIENHTVNHYYNMTLHSTSPLCTNSYNHHVITNKFTLWWNGGGLLGLVWHWLTETLDRIQNYSLYPHQDHMGSVSRNIQVIHILL